MRTLLVVKLEVPRKPFAGGAVMGAILWGLGRPNLGLLTGLLWAVAALGVGANVVAFRTLFYLPTFTAGVALMILWQALYNPQTGPIDLARAAVIHALGLHASPPQWLSDVAWAKPALILTPTAAPDKPRFAQQRRPIPPFTKPNTCQRAPQTAQREQPPKKGDAAKRAGARGFSEQKGHPDSGNRSRVAKSVRSGRPSTGLASPRALA